MSNEIKLDKLFFLTPCAGQKKILIKGLERYEGIIS